ncbi:MAG TPA: DUF1223 domain-containing protein [Steroidobacteraceae bacterium]|nr:DUF1223 domain-containing protein [Steroidobacteraceae bacterium]
MHQWLMASTLLGGLATVNAQSRPAVVELFTSEGCSSCPPAEAYVGELAHRGDVLALAFHVDYWDGLGWRDRFELANAAQRQRGYAKSLRLSSVYTPQVIVDGHRDFVGSDRVAIGKALAARRSAIAVALSLRSGEVLVTVGAKEGGPPSDVVLVAYLRSAVTPIGRGENAGRTIKEYNVVREFRQLGRWDGTDRRYRWPVKSLPRDATDVAVLIQAVGQGAIIGDAKVALR